MQSTEHKLYIPVSRPSCTHASLQHGPSAMLLVARDWAEKSHAAILCRMEWESGLQMQCNAHQKGCANWANPVQGHLPPDLTCCHLQNVIVIVFAGSMMSPALPRETRARMRNRQQGKRPSPTAVRVKRVKRPGRKI